MPHHTSSLIIYNYNDFTNRVNDEQKESLPADIIEAHQWERPNINWALTCGSLGLRFQDKWEL